MEFQAVATSVHCSQPSSSSQTSASAVSSPLSRRRLILLSRSDEKSSPLSAGCKFPTLRRSRSCEIPNSRVRTIRRALSASFDSFSDDDFARRFEEEFSVELARRKKQWQEGVSQAGETAYCSVKKAFSSTVFIILELHSFALQLREILFYENLQGILANVQMEIHASFVWLFQNVFSHTPMLMVYVMIFLANYSVYSMSTTASMAATSPLPTYSTQEVSAMEDQKNTELNLNSSSIGEAIPLGGKGGGGSKHRPVASDTDGEDRFNASSGTPTITPDEETSCLNKHPTGTNNEESISLSEEEENLWISVTDDASKMEADSRNGVDQDAVQGLVSPVNARMESDDYSEDYFSTELQYEMELAQDPNNSLLLANFAQFLYLVVKDFDRAEEYFKRATMSEPKDAEALNKYARFLWVVRNDLWAAEETFLEAIDAEPENPFYPADYAHFLWNTDGQDTCFPLS